MHGSQVVALVFSVVVLLGFVLYKWDMWMKRDRPGGQGTKPVVYETPEQTYETMEREADDAYLAAVQHKMDLEAREEEKRARNNYYLHARKARHRYSRREIFE